MTNTKTPAPEPISRGFTIDQMKAAYIAGYAQGNCLSGTLEGDEEWEEYLSCIVLEDQQPDDDEEERDQHCREAESDFLNHVSQLKQAREWE